MKALPPNQEIDPVVVDSEYREFIIPDSLKGEQRIIARFVTQLETPSSFYRFFQGPENPPKAYLWMMVPAPWGPGFIHRLIQYEAWRDLECAVGDIKNKDLVKCLAEGSIGITSH
jgi:hypothetical protein